MAPQKKQPPKIAHRPTRFGYKWAAKHIGFGEGYWKADPFKDKFVKAAEYYDIVDTWTHVLANEGKDKSFPELFNMFIWHVGARDIPCTTPALRLGAIEGRNRELAGVQTYCLNGIDPETGKFTLPFSRTWDCFQKLGWPGTHGPPGASTTLQHHSSDPYGGYSRVWRQLIWFHDHKCHDFWSSFAAECQTFSHTAPHKYRVV